uniref:Uncharacterized protein n=1 Tax=Anguilla anguilla TaxID=7936 RepID=A0A0E9VF54_ANGAN
MSYRQVKQFLGINLLKTQQNVKFCCKAYIEREEMKDKKHLHMGLCFSVGGITKKEIKY